MATIEIIHTQAVDYFGGYYPKEGDEIEIDEGNGTLNIVSGFDKLRAVLNDQQCVQVDQTIFVSKWLGVDDSSLQVQVIINLDPQSLTFIWKLDGKIISSGISTGGGN